MQELKSWLVKHRAEVLPKNPMAEAINYTLNQRDALNIYTCNGHLAIDNHTAERVVKRVPLEEKTGCSLVLIKGESVDYSVKLHCNLPAVRGQSLGSSSGYPNQVACYSCRATPHAFANQVIKSGGSNSLFGTCALSN